MSDEIGICRDKPVKSNFWNRAQNDLKVGLLIEFDPRNIL